MQLIIRWIKIIPNKVNSLIISSIQAFSFLNLSLLEFIEEKNRERRLISLQATQYMAVPLSVFFLVITDPQGMIRTPGGRLGTVKSRKSDKYMYACKHSLP